MAIITEEEVKVKSKHTQTQPSKFYIKHTQSNKSNIINFKAKCKIKIDDVFTWIANNSRKMKRKKTQQVTISSLKCYFLLKKRKAKKCEKNIWISVF